jgi:hypothetical protein
MDTKTRHENDYVFVYKKSYAMELIAKGHMLFTTMPNPQKPNLMMWVFIRTPAFTADFDALLGGGRRND